MKYICGIDIGSSKVAACLGSLRGRELTNLWWDSTAAVGVKRGQWKDIGGLTACLAQLLKNLKAKSGMRIQSVHLAIASQNIVTKHSQAIIALAERGNKSITKTDILNVNHQAQVLGSCLEHEILHTEPLSYTVDNENEVINPLGLYGHQLRVDLYLICAKVSYINTAIEVISRLGLKLNDITLSGLAASQAVFNPQELRGLNILSDIGKDITQILIFNDGRLMHYQIINCGADDLTASLSEQLNIPYSLAEEVKISYGSIQNSHESIRFHSGPLYNQQPRDERPDKEIIIKKGDAYSTLSQKSVIQILSRSSRQIAEAMRDVIRPHLLAISSPLTPTKATLYVSGRTAHLDGFLELLEVVIGIPVKMAKIGNSSLLDPLMRNRILSGKPILNYLVCLGLIAKAVNLSNKRLSRPTRDFRSLLSNIPEKVKEIYQEYF